MHVAGQEIDAAADGIQDGAADRSNLSLVAFWTAVYCCANGDGRPMLLSEEKAKLYREEARVAREKASRAPTIDLRSAYEQMASDWIYLAEQAEKLTARTKTH